LTGKDKLKSAIQKWLNMGDCLFELIITPVKA
jgi:hypothetical protein